MELIDTHAHLDFPEFDRDREEVIARADRKGVEVINSCLTPQGFEMMRRFGGIYLMIGCGPYKFDEYDVQRELIRKHIGDVIGIGEIGLDYHWVKDPGQRERERENFIQLLGIAKEHDKPVLIHSRDAEKDALGILEGQGVERAVMHCFSGSMEVAMRAVDLGYLVSIPTTVIRSKQKQKFARRLPLESIVLETDAPYLSPIPDTKNEPINIIQSAQKIAELRGITAEEVARATTKNARDLFGI